MMYTCASRLNMATQACDLAFGGNGFISRRPSDINLSGDETFLTLTASEPLTRWSSGSWVNHSGSWKYHMSHSHAALFDALSPSVRSAL